MRPKPLIAAVSLSLIATSAGVVTTPTASTAEAAPPPLMFGLIDKTTSHVASDDRALSIRSGIVGTFFRWSTVKPADAVGWMRWVRGRGGLPMLDLLPPTTATLGDIADGSQDGYLVRLARAFASWGHPVLLRVLPEMNTHRESYSPGTDGQTTGDYLAAFRHMVGVFRSQGPTGVRIVWNPNRVFKGSTPLKTLWPGAGYVDWVAADFYNWHDSRHGSFTPYQLLHPTIRAIRTLTSKPFFVAELGCAPYAGKPTWVSHSLPVARGLGARAVVWFDEQPGSGGPDWRLDSSPAPATLRAARTAVHRSGVTWAGRADLRQVDSFARTGS